MVEITENTRLMDLIKKYPFLKDELPKRNPKFKLLKTPMAKVLMRNATINGMAKRSGIEVNEIINMLKDIIRTCN